MRILESKNSIVYNIDTFGSLSEIIENYSEFDFNGYKNEFLKKSINFDDKDNLINLIMNEDCKNDLLDEFKLSILDKFESILDQEDIKKEIGLRFGFDGNELHLYSNNLDVNLNKRSFKLTNDNRVSKFNVEKVSDIKEKVEFILERIRLLYIDNSESYIEIKKLDINKILSVKCEVLSTVLNRSNIKFKAIKCNDDFVLDYDGYCEYVKNVKILARLCLDFTIKLKNALNYEKDDIMSKLKFSIFRRKLLKASLSYLESICDTVDEFERDILTLFGEISELKLLIDCNECNFYNTKSFFYQRDLIEFLIKDGYIDINNNTLKVIDNIVKVGITKVF